MFKFTHSGSDNQHEIHIVTDDYGKFMDLLEIAVSMTDSDRRKYASAMTSVEVPKEDVENVPCEIIEKPSKPKFKLDDYADDRYVMHCATEEDAKTFCNFLDANGRHWHDGNSYKCNTEWSEYEEDTIYRFNGGFYGCIEFCEREDVVLEFDKFDWSDYEN